MPPLEALPTPVEEVLRRGVQSLISFYFIASSRPSVGFCEVNLVPLVVLPGELSFLLVTVHDRRVGRGAHRVRPGGEDAVVGPPVVGNPSADAVYPQCRRRL